MNGLWLAIRFLTRLPTPDVPAGAGDFARSMRWFPLVGLLIGGLLLGIGRAGALLDPMAGAALALAFWVLATGALHLDGLGDLADAIGVAPRGDRARLLAVLADPHIGSFGVAAIALQLLMKFALLQALFVAEIFWPLALVPFAARIAPLFWNRLLPQLHDGLAARFADAVRLPSLTLWGGALLALTPLVPALAIFWLFLPLWGWWLRRFLGGISGDGHGAGIELLESLLLLALLVGARFA